MQSCRRIAILSAGPSVADKWRVLGSGPYELIICVNVVPLEVPGLLYDWLVAGDAYTFECGLANRPAIGYCTLPHTVKTILDGLDYPPDDPPRIMTWDHLEIPEKGGIRAQYSAVAALCLALMHVAQGTVVECFGFDMTDGPCIGGHTHPWTSRRKRREPDQMRQVIGRIRQSGGIVLRADPRETHMLHDWDGLP